MKKLWLIFAALFAAAAPAAAKSKADDETIQIMVVGSYHMAGSTSDLVKVETDSVLTERRQIELQRVAKALATFNPTVVVTERETDAPDYIDPFYAEFDDKMLSENPNERVQVAYRLARTAGVSRVYGIDEQPSEGEPDYFPFDRLMAHAEATGQSEALQAMLDKFQGMVSDEQQAMRDQPIGEQLLRVNTGLLSSADFYYALSAFDRGEDQPAAELQAYWFMRNAKIFSKLMNIAKPGDRIVIVYGAGHKYWLEHFAEHTPGFAKIDPAPYLKRAK